MHIGDEISTERNTLQKSEKVETRKKESWWNQIVKKNKRLDQDKKGYATEKMVKLE